MFRESRNEHPDDRTLNRMAECGIAVTLSVMFFASLGGIDDTRKAISAVQAYRNSPPVMKTITRPWVVTDKPSTPGVAPVAPTVAPVAERSSVPAVAPVAPGIAPVAPAGCRKELKALNLCAKPPEEKAR